MSAEVEMGEQDMMAIVAMERSQEKEKETVSDYFPEVNHGHTILLPYIIVHVYVENYLIISCLCGLLCFLVLHNLTILHVLIRLKVFEFGLSLYKK